MGQTRIEPIAWLKISIMAVKSFDKYSMEKTIWYPSANPYTDSIVIYTIKNIFLHWLPAHIIDFIMLLIGQKRL